jgi:hypothetical protein
MEIDIVVTDPFFFFWLESMRRKMHRAKDFIARIEFHVILSNYIEMTH